MRRAPDGSGKGYLLELTEEIDENKNTCSKVVGQLILDVEHWSTIHRAVVHGEAEHGWRAFWRNKH